MVRYESRGSVLVTGDAARALPAARRLAAAGLTVFALLRDGGNVSRTRGLTVAPGRIASIGGFLGRFSATAAGAGGQTIDLGPQSRNADQRFDLVLDLDAPPAIGSEVKPLGYFAPGEDAPALESALAEIPKWVGVREKPRYVAYEPGLCAHGAQGLKGCTLCLDACPAGAIRSGGDRIVVEFPLCQGCGTCTAACPSGALRYDHPPAARTLQRLGELLGLSLADTEGSRGLVVHEAGAELPVTGAGWRAFDVPALASFGIECWFSALAGSIDRLVLALPRGLPASTARVLDEQLSLARELLSAVGHDAGGIEMVPEETIGQRTAVPPEPASRRWMPDRAAGARKREVLFDALDALAAGEAPSWGARPLPANSPFGTLEIDQAACTLCLACAHICPAGALQGREEVLEFVEAACVQCGLCAVACPEKAIRLTPRFVAQPSQRGERRAVARASLFQCVQCGTPFAPRALVEKSKALLAGRTTLAGEGGRLLELCPSCRVFRATGRSAGP
jgi:ferredoxin